jgi:hypothetical protein
MKKILIGTALAGMIVGTFASFSFAAPLPARLDNGNGAIVNVADGCGPYGHRVHFRNRFGRLVAGRCVRDRRVHDRYDRYR